MYVLYSTYSGMDSCVFRYFPSTTTITSVRAPNAFIPDHTIKLMKLDL